MLLSTWLEANPRGQSDDVINQSIIQSDCDSIAIKSCFSTHYYAASVANCLWWRIPLGRAKVTQENRTKASLFVSRLCRTAWELLTIEAIQNDRQWKKIHQQSNRIAIGFIFRIRLRAALSRSLLGESEYFFAFTFSIKRWEIYTERSEYEPHIRTVPKWIQTNQKLALNTYRLVWRRFLGKERSNTSSRY